MENFDDIQEAFFRVADGRVEGIENNDDFVCRTLAKGKILGRANCGTRGRDYRTEVVLVQHPTLADGEVFALFCLGLGEYNAYRCREEDARLAIKHPSAFNLG